MENNNLFIQMRTKKIGILLADARQSKNIEIENLVKRSGIPEERLRQFESGQAAPSLAELERLADEFGVPVDHFWGSQLIQTTQISDNISPQEQINHRNNEISNFINEKFLESGFSPAELSNAFGFDEQQFNQILAGEEMISIPALEVIGRKLGFTIPDLKDPAPSAAEPKDDKNSSAFFENLPEDVKNFISQPENSKYIEIAYQLSLLDKSSMRSIAEIFQTFSS